MAADTPHLVSYSPPCRDASAIQTLGKCGGCRRGMHVAPPPSARGETPAAHTRCASSPSLPNPAPSDRPDSNPPAPHCYGAFAQRTVIPPRLPISPRQHLPTANSKRPRPNRNPNRSRNSSPSPNHSPRPNLNWTRSRRPMPSNHRHSSPVTHLLPKSAPHSPAGPPSRYTWSSS